MAAPTPVSAYLHSATLVKAGVFLLARLWPVLSGTELWFWLVSTAGMTTLVLGAYIAMFQHDLKRVLAYSTVSHLGLITLLFGLNSPLAAVAGVFHIMNHATFKASLFMAAGVVDHETGTRDIRRLNGLMRFMPRTGLLALVATAAMAGVPLLNGFLSKEMFFAETMFLSSHRWVEVAVPVLATVAAIFAVVYSLRFGYDIFFGPPSTDLPRQPEEAPRWMRTPMRALGAQLPDRRDRTGDLDRAVARGSRTPGGRRDAPRLQPRRVARLQHALRHELRCDLVRRRWLPAGCASIRSRTNFRTRPSSRGSTADVYSKVRWSGSRGSREGPRACLEGDVFRRRCSRSSRWRCCWRWPRRAACRSSGVSGNDCPHRLRS